MPGTWLKPYEGKGALRGFLVSRVVFTKHDDTSPSSSQADGERAIVATHQSGKWRGNG